MEDKIRVLIPEEDVNRKISEIAALISRDYAGKALHLICIKKAACFLPVSWLKG